MVKGEGKLLADAWYDDNKGIGEMFKQGYEPIVKPNKNRDSGYWRKKARKIFNDPFKKCFYKQRPRGESLFGSLTNEFGDRLKTSRYESSITRIGARIIVHMTKIYMRVNNFLIILMNY